MMFDWEAEKLSLEQRLYRIEQDADNTRFALAMAVASLAIVIVLLV